MAIQTHAESPLFTRILFAPYIGAVMWGGLWFQMAALRRLFPLARF